MPNITKKIVDVTEDVGEVVEDVLEETAEKIEDATEFLMRPEVLACIFILLIMNNILFLLVLFITCLSIN